MKPYGSGAGIVNPVTHKHVRAIGAYRISFLCDALVSAIHFALSPETQFVFINADGWKAPDEWEEYSNWSVDNYQGLETFLVDYPI